MSRTTAALDVLDRQPPADLDSEMCLVGSMIVDPQVIDDVALEVKAADFYDDANAVLFEVICVLWDQNVGVDGRTVATQLKDTGQFERVGGASYVGRVIGSVATAANALHFARRVRDRSVWRQSIEAAVDLLTVSYEASGDAEDAIGAATDRLLAISQQTLCQRPTGATALMHDAMEQLERRMGTLDSGGLRTGFTDLDELTGGLHDGQLIVVGARPSMGKSALLLNVVEHVTGHQEKTALVVSLEMSEAEYSNRLLSSVAKVDSYSILHGTLNDGERSSVVEAAGTVATTGLHIIDDPTASVAKISSHARSIKRRHGLDLLAIDYLQLIKPADEKAPRQEQVAKIARGLKTLARSLDVPVLVACQLNRQGENGAKTEPPTLSNLRESGAIEQDADVVMFVHRPEYYCRDDDALKGLAIIPVAKVRNGPTDTIELVWRKEFTRFEDMAPERCQAFDDYNERGLF